MQGLAQFVMRGRLQALIVACVSAGTVLFFWVGAAALALVTLRKGWVEGLILLLWALLPAGLALYLAREFAPLAAFLGSFATALVLRTTVSWPATLVVAALCGAATGLVMLGFAGAYVGEIKAMVDQFIQQYQSTLAEQGQTLQLSAPSAGFIVGIFALVDGLTVTLCVILGRYWQAALYNPGGFGAEFRQLRLPPALALALLAVAVGCLLAGGAALPWGYLATLPCLFAGIGLVHGMAGLRQLRRGWLVLFYLLLVLINPMKELVILAAVADSWFDFRRRAAGGA